MHRPIGGEQVARPDRAAMGRELEAVLQQAINDLEEEHRTLIVLREIEGLSYQEISEVTNLPLGTIKSRLHRARLKLKNAVATYRNAEPAPNERVRRRRREQRQKRARDGTRPEPSTRRVSPMPAWAPAKA